MPHVAVAQKDIQSNLIDARQEGRQEGIEIGEQRGEQRGKRMASIQIYEGLLGDSLTSDSDLQDLSIEQLESKATLLKKLVRDRTS
jgi:hypothetical protein